MAGISSLMGLCTQNTCLVGHKLGVVHVNSPMVSQVHLLMRLGQVCICLGISQGFRNKAGDSVTIIV